MRIAYIAYIDAYQLDGVMKKIISQISYWKKLNCLVDLYCICSYKSINTVYPGTTVCSILPAKFANIPVVKFINRNLACIQLNNELNTRKPDIIYYRYDLYNPILMHVLSRHSPYIVECNADDLKEFRMHGYIRYFYNKYTRNIVFEKSSGIVAVTHELCGIIDKYGKDSVVIGNGFDTANTPHFPPPHNEKPHAVFVGTPNQIWQGFDKIIAIAPLIPEVTFHIVGPSRADFNGILSNNIVVHGYKNKSDIEEVYKKSDVAIGTLALHRKKMNEASPLKVREYLAYGLPTIIGYSDTDIGDDYPFMLNIGNFEENVCANIHAIKEFCVNMMGKRVDYNKVLPLIDIEEKERVRVNFFNKQIELQKKRNIN